VEERIATLSLLRETFVKFPRLFVARCEIALQGNRERFVPWMRREEGENEKGGKGVDRSLRFLPFPWLKGTVSRLHTPKATC